MRWLGGTARPVRSHRAIERPDRSLIGRTKPLRPRHCRGSQEQESSDVPVDSRDHQRALPGSFSPHLRLACLEKASRISLPVQSSPGSSPSTPWKDPSAPRSLVHPIAPGVRLINWNTHGRRDVVVSPVERSAVMA